MASIDNFDLIANNLLTFRNKNEFYFVQVIQRKKDGNEDMHISSGYRRIRAFYVYSAEELCSLRARIIGLCRANNAKAYISIIPKNAKEVALECIKKYSELILNDNAFMGNHIWDSCCGSTKAKGAENLCTIDIDTMDQQIVQIVTEMLGNVRGQPTIKLIVPTVNGCHIITTGFDQKQFKARLTDDYGIDCVSVQKKTILRFYITRNQYDI